jgi:hypothetical protein
MKREKVSSQGSHYIRYQSKILGNVNKEGHSNTNYYKTLRSLGLTDNKVDIKPMKIELYLEIYKFVSNIIIHLYSYSTIMVQN